MREWKKNRKKVGRAERMEGKEEGMYIIVKYFKKYFKEYFKIFRKVFILIGLYENNSRGDTFFSFI